MYKNTELKLLSSARGLEYLLDSDKLDFDAVLAQLKYEQEIKELQAEMINFQNWVVEKNKRVLILAEGREFAGKGGALHVFSEHLNPRSIRMVALKKPLPKEREQWYFKRYVEHLPERGEIVFFDRSWYNRALVEPVNGFCTQKEYKRFMKEVIHFERMLTEDGIILFKLYFAISKKEQKRRISAVRKNPLRRWELTQVDLKAIELWDKYSDYELKMLETTSSKLSPWYVFRSDDKREARLTAFYTILELLKTEKNSH